jgi:hypothetical protein
MRITTRLAFVLSLLGAGACTTLPAPKQTKHAFPTAGVYVQEPRRTYKTLGVVRAKVNYETLDPVSEERDLCRNYYNKAVKELLEKAKDQAADAVVDVKSVVFLADGRRETYPTPECSDDGQEGQILVQGVAVQWTETAEPAPAPAPAKKGKK